MSFYGYKVGTIQVTNGSTAVVGTSTLWGSGAVVDGDLLQVLGAGTDNILYEIQVNSDTSITLDRNYGGSNGSGLTYVIYRQSVTRDSYSAVSQQVSDFVAAYRSLITVTGANRYFTLDKTASTDDAGLWFKTGGVSKFRAGLFGDNNYHLQWLNSSTWTDSLLIDAATGAVSTPAIKTFSNTTDASAIGTASVVMVGGLSVAKRLWVGGNARVAVNNGVGNNAIQFESRQDGVDTEGTGASNWARIGLFYGTSAKASAAFGLVAKGDGRQGGVGIYTKAVNDDTTEPSIKLCVSTAGNVGIGTTNPGVKLEVAGVIKSTDSTASTSTTTGALVVAGGVGIGGAAFMGTTLSINTTATDGRATLYDGSGGTGLYVKNTNTGANIGVAIICETLNASGSTRYLAYFKQNGENCGDIHYDGANVVYATTSDARLKEDFLTPPNSTDVIKKFRVWDYRWKQSGQRNIGVVAQEVLGVFPAAVGAPPRGHEDDPVNYPYTIENSKFVPLLICALQEADARISALEAKTH